MSKRLNKGFTLVELLIVIVIVGILALAAILLVNGYVERSKASEAETSIGTIKRNLEDYHSEIGTDAADLTQLEAASYVQSGGYDGQFYDTYAWTGGVQNGRFVGTITATGRANSGAPTVDIVYAADGTATITCTSQ